MSKKKTIKEVVNQRKNNENKGKKLGGVTGKGFVPGQSGNPKGRPKGVTISELLRELLEEYRDVKIKGSDKVEKKQLKNILAETLLNKAAKGDMRAMTEMLDRTEGKVTDKIDHTTKGDKLNEKIQIEILRKKES